MNKKASLSDTITAPIYILVIGAVMVLAFFIWSSISTEFRNMPYQDSNLNASIQNMLDDISPVYNTFDYMIPFLVGTLLIISLILAFRRGANVAYIGLSLVFWILAVILSQVYTNIFDNFILAFPTVSGSFPILAFVMDNMKWIVLAWLFLISVVMFTRNKKEDQQIQQSEQIFYQ